VRAVRPQFVQVEFLRRQRVCPASARVSVKRSSHDLCQPLRLRVRTDSDSRLFLRPDVTSGKRTPILSRRIPRRANSLRPSDMKRRCPLERLVHTLQQFVERSGQASEFILAF